MTDDRIARIAEMHAQELAELIQRVLPMSEVVRRTVEMAAVAEVLKLTDAEFFEFVRCCGSFGDQLLSEIAVRISPH